MNMELRFFSSVAVIIERSMHLVYVDELWESLSVGGYIAGIAAVYVQWLT